MGSLLAFAVIISGVVALVAAYILWLVNKVGHSAVTAHFKDAEFILEHHHAPGRWRKNRGLSKLFGRRPDPAAEKAALLQQLEKLIHYFESSPLIQDPQAKRILIEQLTAERAAWEDRSAANILGR